MGQSLSQILTKLADGNPKALSALMAILNKPVFAIDIISTLDEYLIKGEDIYVLYCDLCNTNIKTIYHLCITVPPHILKDACSKRDYSNKKLIHPFMPKYHEKEKQD